jgi:hypothetical protein
MAVSTDSVVLINPFEVPPEAEEGFIAGWERARDFPATQGGYRSTQLHRSLGSDAEFRLVNVAEWASLGASRRPPATRLPWAGAAGHAHPGLYRVLREDPPSPRTRAGWC